MLPTRDLLQIERHKKLNINGKKMIFYANRTKKSWYNHSYIRQTRVKKTEAATSLEEG